MAEPLIVALTVPGAGSAASDPTAVVQASTGHHAPDVLDGLRRDLARALILPPSADRDARLAALVERASTGLAVIAPNASVVAANHAAVLILGGTQAGQVIGRDLRSFVAAEDIPVVNRTLARTDPSDAAPCLVTVHTLDGRHVDVLLRPVVPRASSEVVPVERPTWLADAEPAPVRRGSASDAGGPRNPSPAHDRPHESSLLPMAETPLDAVMAEVVRLRSDQAAEREAWQRARNEYDYLLAAHEADRDSWVETRATLEARLTEVQEAHEATTRALETLRREHAANLAALRASAVLPGAAPAGPDAAQGRRLQDIGGLTVAMAADLESLASAAHYHHASARAAGRAGAPEAAADVVQDLHQRVRQLVSFARRQSTPLEATRLDDLVEQARPTLRHVLGEYLDFDLDLSPALVQASRPDLTDLLVSVATAGRDALPLGGRLRMTLHAEATRGLAAVLTVTAKGYGAKPDPATSRLAPATTRCGALLQVTHVPGEVTFEVRFTTAPS